VSSRIAFARSAAYNVRAHVINRLNRIPVKHIVAALGFLIVVGCTNQPATQYVGTVMNEASPEAAASLRLTLISRSDTSFTGIVELGPPAKGTGSAYLWFEGSELRMSSVAATGGDTIFWTSKLTDEGLGGHYEITGGPRTGQGGTWRAGLTSGVPATPATLRLPNADPGPPLSAYWTLLIVLASAIAVTRWTQRTPRPVVSEAPDGLDAPVKRAFTIPDTLTPGISGWLLLFVIGQCVGAITGLIRIGQLRSDYRESFGLGLIITGMSPLVVLEIAVQVLAPLIAIVGTVLTVRRSRYAPRFWFGYFVFSIGYLAVDLGMMLYVQSELGRLLGAAYRAESGGYSTFGRGLFRALIASAVWAAYWARSHRVRVTFGAAALDHIAYPVRHVADAAIIPADPIGPHRRKRKLALRVAGGIIGAVILLGLGIVTGVSRTRAKDPPAA